MDEYRQTFEKRCRGSRRYSADNIPFLEKYVKVQCETGGYDLDANLTLLKLYQLNPGCFSDSIVTRILLLCLKALPKTDMLLAKCLIDNDRVETENPNTIKMVYDLSELLETCSLKKVWENMETLLASVDIVAGFREAIRAFAARIIDITYQNIEVTLLKDLLGNPDNEGFDELVKKHGWKLNGDVAFITNHEATIKCRSIEEKIELSDIQHIIRKMLA
ncbi:Eukaryotic translation initiation factor 3 [Trichuris trichiura]|uniref:Eukaryotic translation initiation factor 3 subunit K n=1 Tax=Trichuris trichiura TaxID=36087 RepID=A0A077ZDA6_TRITR|nr:Eukaryotic translation initiation factor 3 [Trichuris trichiura]